MDSIELQRRLSNIEEKLDKVVSEIPTLVLTRNIVFTGLGAVGMTILLTVVSLVTKGK